MATFYVEVVADFGGMAVGYLHYICIPVLQYFPKNEHNEYGCVFCEFWVCNV